MHRQTLSDYIKRMSDETLGKLEEQISKEIGRRKIPRAILYMGFKEFKSEDLHQFIVDINEELNSRGENSELPKQVSKEKYIKALREIKRIALQAEQIYYFTKDEVKEVIEIINKVERNDI